MTTFTPNASWQPVYDIRLTSGDAPALDIDRFVTVSQNSGEDWGGIEVTLSTARPSEQSAPTPVYPWQRRIESEDAAPVLRKSVGAGIAMSESDMAVMAAPMMEPEAISETAQMEMMGATATYRYGGRVDIRDGVEALRLKLDTLALTPEVRAVAVPGRDQSAFAVAEVTNTGGALILPGQAMLFRDGALIGQSWLPLIAGGDTADIGFGPIDGIRLTRTVPERSEGDRGMITRSNRIDEVAILSRGKPDRAGLADAGDRPGALFGTGRSGDQLHRHPAGDRGRCGRRARGAGVGLRSGRRGEARDPAGTLDKLAHGLRPAIGISGRNGGRRGQNLSARPTAGTGRAPVRPRGRAGPWAPRR